MLHVDLSYRLPTGSPVGTYRIREWLAAGGTSDLYLCDSSDQAVAGRPDSRFVAKVFRFEGSDNDYDRRVRLFRKEIETLVSLNGNIHIIPVLGHGDLPDMRGTDFVRPFAILPRLSGGTLTSRIRNKPLTAEEACTITLGLTEALDYAHTRDILHCDIKPDNVMLDESGNPVWVDFGIAKQMETGDDAVSVMSEIGSVAVGTAPYMSPEHFFGRHALSPQSDIWSIGVLLIRMLTREYPFGEHFEQVRQRVKTKSWTHLEDLPAFREDGLPATIAAPLQSIILTCLQVTLDDRYASAKHLIEDLRAFLRRQPLPNAPERVTRRRAEPRPAAILQERATGLTVGTGAPDLPWRSWALTGLMGVILMIVVSTLVFRNVLDTPTNLPDDPAAVLVPAEDSLDVSSPAGTILDAPQRDPSTPQAGTSNNEVDRPLRETGGRDSLQRNVESISRRPILVIMVPNIGYNPEKVVINGENVHPNQGLLKRFSAFAGQRFTWEIQASDGQIIKHSINLPTEPPASNEVKIDWQKASIIGD